MLLYEPLNSELSRYCSSLCGDTERAKDLISDTVLAAFERFTSSNEAIEHFKSYLFRIASNLYKKSLRRNKFKGNYQEHVAMELPGNHTNAEAYTDLNLLKSMLQQLPLEQREVFILHEINGFKLAEIAGIQQVGLSSVKQRAKRARDTLAQLLKEPGGASEHSTNETFTLKMSYYGGKR